MRPCTFSSSRNLRLRHRGTAPTIAESPSPRWLARCGWSGGWGLACCEPSSVPRGSRRQGPAHAKRGFAACGRLRGPFDRCAARVTRQRVPGNPARKPSRELPHGYDFHRFPEFRLAFSFLTDEQFRPAAGQRPDWRGCTRSAASSSIRHPIVKLYVPGNARGRGLLSAQSIPAPHRGFAFGPSRGPGLPRSWATSSLDDCKSCGVGGDLSRATGSQLPS